MKPHIVKTLRVTEAQIEILREKFSYIESKNWSLIMDITRRTWSDPDWISLHIKVNETWRSHTLCWWDYDWIMTPWKLEMHIFWVGRDIGEEHILSNL